MNDKGLNDYFKNRISSSWYEGFLKNFANSNQYSNVNVWTYKIKFTSKADLYYTKTMDGYIFTIN